MHTPKYGHTLTEFSRPTMSDARTMRIAVPPAVPTDTLRDEQRIIR